MLFVPILLFALGLVVLIKGGDWFVDGATGIARRFKLPELLIGATVVSIGTTLPEVMVSATSAVAGHGDIAYGNAIGSIICNTSLIAALTVAIRPSKVERKSLLIPVTFFFIAAIVYVGVAYLGAEFSRLIGVILLGIFLIYMTFTVLSMKKDDGGCSVNDDEPEENEGMSDEEYKSLSRGKKLLAHIKGTRATPVREVLLLIIGATLIAWGADLLVDNGIIIAEYLGVPESVIALTFVALGTSLPELVTAITSLVKGHSSLSLGNIIGANLFNLVLVSGVSIVLSPFKVPVGSTIGGMNASLVIDLPVMLAVMLILTVPALIRGKLSRVQGICLLAIYAAFCSVQFIM